jgi:alcohol dehydrogenase class IV
MSSYGGDLGFNHYQPTRVTFGTGAVKEAGLECKRLGITRAAIVTDKILREKTDVVAKVEQALGTRLAGTFDGVVPDSPADAIDRAAAWARGVGADGLVSVGGGSAIDTTKGMAIVLTEGGGIRDHQGSQRLTRRQTPHLAIPTTAGTGSEVTGFAVVLGGSDGAHEKMHFADDKIIPDAAILDPALTVGMPRALTAATAADALTHAVEAYLSIARNPIADANSLHAIRLIARFLPKVLSDGSDLVARGQLLLAANLAGMAFNGSGVGLCHAMAHVIGARHGVHHGTANAICLPHVMRFCADELAPRLAEVGDAMGLHRGASDEESAEDAARAVAALLKSTGLPTRLADVKVPEGDLDTCAGASLADAAIVYNGKFAADHDLVLGVYRQAY